MIPREHYVSEGGKLNNFEEIHINHRDCSAGADSRRRLYIKRNNNLLLAYCHNCGEGGAMRMDNGKGVDRLEDLLERIDTWNKEEASLSPLTPASQLPDDITYQPSDFPVGAREWTDKYISVSEMLRFHISYSPSWGRVILPVFDKLDNLVFWQARRVLGSPHVPKYLTAKGAKNPYFYVEPITMVAGEAHKTLVLVEDYMSAIVVGRHFPALALFGKEFDASTFLHNTLCPWGRLNRVVIMLDGDHAGRTAAPKVATTLGLIAPAHMNVDIFCAPAGLDPKDMSTSQIMEHIGNGR